MQVPPYQNLANNLIQEHIERNIEVYIDDIIVKSNL